MRYEADRVRGWFDAYQGREWSRLEATLVGRIRYAIHRRFLIESLEPGMRVADVGCGPGRFAIDAIRAGARVTLIDLSPEMLRQAREHVEAAGLGDGVDAYLEADVCDLAMVDRDRFDLVLCYGGAVSYAYDRHAEALAELARIAKPGAPLLIGVMSLLGAMRLLGTLDAVGSLGGWSRHLPEVDWAHDDIVLTVPESDEWHLPLALFNAAGLERALDAAGCAVERFGVANPLTALGQPLEAIAASPNAAARLTALELALCERPGLRDAGEHLIAVARKKG